MTWLALGLAGIAGGLLWLLLRARAALARAETLNALLEATNETLRRNAAIDAAPMDGEAADDAARDLAGGLRPED